MTKLPETKDKLQPVDITEDFCSQHCIGSKSSDDHCDKQLELLSSRQAGVIDKIMYIFLFKCKI